MSASRWPLALLGLTFLPSCAWSNPDNRPLWNAFEEHLVPDDEVAFYATLPLTVPGGVLALLADTFVVHPAQVMDDAVDDALELWTGDDPDWSGAYYTEMAFLPLRVAATPVVLSGSFVGRSLFDIHRGEAEDAAVVHERQQEERRRMFVAWLEGLPRHPGETFYAFPEWREELSAPLTAALGRGAMVRAALHRAMLGSGLLSFGVYDAVVGLRDPDPVVRFAALEAWPEKRELPADCLRAMCDDSSEAVRELARQRASR